MALLGVPLRPCAGVHWQLPLPTSTTAEVGAAFAPVASRTPEYFCDDGLYDFN